MLQWTNKQEGAQHPIRSHMPMTPALLVRGRRKRQATSAAGDLRPVRDRSTHDDDDVRNGAKRSRMKKGAWRKDHILHLEEVSK